MILTNRISLFVNNHSKISKDFVYVENVSLQEKKFAVRILVANSAGRIRDPDLKIQILNQDSRIQILNPDSDDRHLMVMNGCYRWVFNIRGDNRTLRY